MSVLLQTQHPAIHGINVHFILCLVVLLRDFTGPLARWDVGPGRLKRRFITSETHGASSTSSCCVMSTSGHVCPQGSRQNWFGPSAKLQNPFLHLTLLRI